MRSGHAEDSRFAKRRQQALDRASIRPRSTGWQRDQAVCWSQLSGASDAAVVRPRLGSQRGVVISCGMNPAYGDFDPYHMAASAIDEAVRNAVAVGADPKRIAILDNFCWGNTDRPETLGTWYERLWLAMI